MEPPQQTPDKTSAGWNGRTRRLKRLRALWTMVGHGQWSDMDNGRTWTMVGHGQWLDLDNGRTWTIDGHGQWSDMDNGRTWTMVGHGQCSDMDNGRAWTSLRFLAPGCWLARARVYRTHQITPDERRAPRSRPLTREQSAALRVRAHKDPPSSIINSLHVPVG